MRQKRIYTDGFVNVIGGETKTMPSISEVYPKKQLEELAPLLNASNVKQGPTTLTISGAAVKQIKGDTKVVLSFKERREEHVNNNTHAHGLPTMYGQDCNGFIGKHTVLVLTTLRYAGDAGNARGSTD